ncbi:MAG TPA: TolC family protein, partial [Saprospiraceae bacterium]|nr:TolC family protein [Saprospiraceae bacterium]
RISQADAEVARLNNTRANAGMLPTVNLVAGDNLSLNAIQYQEFFNGATVNRYGVLSNNLNAGVQLNWTLFDGRRMFITKHRLEQLEALGQISLQARVQQTAAEVLLAYYDIVRSRLQERAITEVIALNEERLRIADARLAAGFAAQTDALQARIDLNQRRADLLNQQTATAAAKRALNRLLVRDPNMLFEVEENLDNAYAPERNTLSQKILAQNPSLLALQKSAEVAALVVDENRPLHKPRIIGNGQFNALRSDNGAGILLSNTQAGFTFGATLSVPLYTGGNLRRQVETSRLAAQQAALRIDAQKQVFETALDNQIALFETQKQVLALEEDNVKNARESLSISTERFRLGQTTALEIQAAQNALEQALTRRNLVLFNLKTSELQLRTLAGDLQY